MASLRSWGDKEIFKNAVESLTEKAAQDIQAEKGLGNSWECLRRKLLELYGPHMSLDERFKALRQLNQKSTETCNEFFSRIDSEMLLIEEDVLKSAASDEEREAMMRSSFFPLRPKTGLNSHFNRFQDPQVILCTVLRERDE
jgi:hypothetical protein